MRTVPDEATSVGRVLHFPPLEEIPAPVRGQSFVMVEMAYLGDEAAASELLAPLRALGPVMDTFAPATPADLLQLHMDPPPPCRASATAGCSTSCPVRPSTRSWP